MNPLASETMIPLRMYSRFSRGRFTLVLTLVITLFLVVLLASLRSYDGLELAPIDPESNRDKLAYISNDYHLMLYDPRDRTEMTLLEQVTRFALGQDGRVAFTRFDKNDGGLYVFDPSQPTSDPITISWDGGVFAFPLQWSPDGRYLAFASSRDSDALSYQGYYRTLSGDPSLYVWDGKNVSNVMPDDNLDTASGFSIDWSHDGRLAFRIEYGWSDDDTPAEIYLWNGSTTSNVSQNPNGHDGGAIWSHDGQLMFGSRRNDESGFYIWDGVSLKDGSPDTNTFIPIAPDLKLGSLTWIKEGVIGFTVETTALFSSKDIVLWDVDTQTILERRPISSDKPWNQLTEGGQVVLSTTLASGLPSYSLDVENTRGDILFSTHTGEFSWSSSGYLAYCRREDQEWILSLWGSQGTWDVARVSYKPVQWQQGEETFSCNSG